LRVGARSFFGREGSPERIDGWSSLNESGGIGDDAFFASGKSHTLVGGGFDGDVVGRDVKEGRHALLHRLYVWVDFGLLGHKGAVDVAHAPSFVLKEGEGTGEEDFAVDVFVLGTGVGKVEPDVAEVGGPEEGIAYGVDEDIGIAVAEKSQVVVYLDAAQP